MRGYTMKAKVLIKTLPGHARKMHNKLKPFILGVRKLQFDTYYSKDDSMIVWIVDGDVRHILAINRNIALYDTIVKGVFNNKTTKKMIYKLADSTDDADQVYKMLRDHTTVMLVKNNMDLDLSNFEKD